ncbi:glycosyltransferase family 2 protein [Weissella sp. MSCH1]|uniref:glycosyltransferase family 2 protein n=1 Tax=Weissella sp. MSCH1 TaxID=3383343 RepID=UPI0038969436
MSNVTIIMPAYNVSDYIETAIKSVLKQTLTDWELIIIDDGSTDDTLPIVQQFIQQDSRIQYVFQENSGQHAARLTGLRLASADFITFLDADDWVSPKWLEIGVRELNDVDMVNVGIEYVYGYEMPKEIQDKKSKILRGSDVLCEWVLERDINGYLCTKFIKKALMMPLLKMSETPKFNYLEDVWTIDRFIDNVNSVAVVEEPLYYYLQRKNSTVHSEMPIEKKKYAYQLVEHLMGRYIGESYLGNCVMYRLRRTYMKMLSSMTISEIHNEKTYLLNILELLKSEDDGFDDMHMFDRLVWKICELKLLTLAMIIRNGLVFLKNGEVTKWLKSHWLVQVVDI